MGTTSEKATAKRRLEAARQREQAALRRGNLPAEPPAIAVKPANDCVTVISYVEPDESAWKSAQKRQPVQSATAISRQEVLVTLQKPFTALAPGADRTVLLSNDAAEMLDHLRFVMAVGGWPAVQETFTRLREIENGLGPVANTCLVQAQVMVNRLNVELGMIEKIARRLLLQRLELGILQTESAAATFLTGWPGLTAAELARHSYIQDKVTLNPGKHVGELKDLLKELPKLNEHVHDAARAYDVVAHDRRYLKNPEVALEPVSMRYHAAQLSKANRILAVSGRWPIVAWLTDLAVNTEADDSKVEADIKDEVVKQIVIAVKAIAVVREEAQRGNRWPVAGGVGYDPAFGPPERLTSPSDPKPRINPPVLNARDLGPNPFTLNMRFPRGPWRYPQMITLALEQSGHGQNTPLAAAARAAMGGEEAAALGIVLSLGAGAVGIASGPVGVGLGIAMALWNLWFEWDKYKADTNGFRAMLDPAWAIHTEASLRGVVAGVLGVLAEVVPGKRALAFVGAEAIVRMTGQ
jgi:hypothetical protein